MKRIAILGSTGSIGKSTLQIVEAYPDRFSVVSLAAGGNVDLAFEQARRWHPRIVSMAAEESADHLRDKLKKVGLGHTIEVVSGSPGTVKVATIPEIDFVVSAIVGVAGLEATFAAVKAGKTVGVANKECLVTAGDLIVTEAHKQGKPLLPIDSEHNAIHQCLRGGKRGRSASHLADCLWRPLPTYPAPPVCPHHSRAGAESSHVEDGKAHHH